MFQAPPLKMTMEIVNLVQDISLLLGSIPCIDCSVHSNVKLRKKNSIRTVKSTVAIEGNSLSLEQVSDVLNGVHVTAPKNELLEVKNAIFAYEQMDTFDAFSIDHLLRAHKIMMAGLTEDAGNFRNSGVGIVKENRYVHVAPPPLEVSGLMSNLFAYLTESIDNLLIKSCVFHYEFEFIHPFCDGNGRIGRFWQQLILSKMHSVFRMICVEELLEKNQEEYYNSLRISDSKGSSEAFVEFMLIMIKTALKNSPGLVPIENNFRSRLLYAKNSINNFKRADYMKIFPNISSATASRDLINGVKSGILKKNNSKNQTTYSFSERDGSLTLCT